MAIDLISGIVLIAFFTAIVILREYWRLRNRPSSKKNWLAILLAIVVVALFVVETLHRLRWI